MDEPVKTLERSITYLAPRCLETGKCPGPGSEASRDGNHSDIRGLLTGGEQSTHDCDSSGAASI